MDKDCAEKVGQVERQGRSYLELIDKNGDGVELVRGIRRICHEERYCG